MIIILEKADPGDSALCVCPSTDLCIKKLTKRMEKPHDTNGVLTVLPPLPNLYPPWQFLDLPLVGAYWLLTIWSFIIALHLGDNNVYMSIVCEWVSWMLKRNVLYIWFNWLQIPALSFSAMRCLAVTILCRSLHSAEYWAVCYVPFP